MQAPGREASFLELTWEHVQRLTNNFSRNRLLGEGGQAQVYGGNWNGTPVAVKVFHGSTATSAMSFSKEVCAGVVGRLGCRHTLTSGALRDTQRARTQVEMLSFLQMPGVMRMIAYAQSGRTHRCIVLESLRFSVRLCTTGRVC